MQFQGVADHRDQVVPLLTEGPQRPLVEVLVAVHTQGKAVLDRERAQQVSVTGLLMQPPIDDVGCRDVSSTPRMAGFSTELQFRQPTKTSMIPLLRRQPSAHHMHHHHCTTLQITAHLRRTTLYPPASTLLQLAHGTRSAPPSHGLMHGTSQ